MTEHADTIRGAFQTYPIPGDDSALAALDALLAENQRYEKALRWYADSPDERLARHAREALAGDAERDASGEPLFPPGCKCSSYGHGLVMTRVTSRTCPVHGEALAGDAE